MDYAKNKQLLEKFATALADRATSRHLLDLLVADTHFPVSSLWKSEFEFSSIFLRAASEMNACQYDTGQSPAERLPLGKVVCILPGNGPIYTMAKILGPAFLMGNDLVFKLPSRLRRSHRVIIEMVHDFFPNVTVEYPDEKNHKSKMLSDALFDPGVRATIIFGDDTWITPFSRMSKETATKMIFEGPGNDPAVVFPGADLQRAAREILAGTFYNGGQSCSAIKRVYVHRDVHQAFREALLAHVGSFKYGAAEDESVGIGPSQGPRLRQRVVE